MTRALRWASSLLIASGLALVTLVAATYVYALVERHLAEQEPVEAQALAAESQPAVEPGRDPVVLPRGEPPPELVPAAAPDRQPPASSASAARTPEPAVAPTPTRSYPPPLRLKLAAAGIDSRVVDVGVVNGEFEVPKFIVGHYRGTANPGQPGNGVFAGHVSSISSGNVFAALGRAKVGDEVLLTTAGGVVRYVVSEVRVVPRTFLDAIQPTGDPTITLISCTGQWDWQLRDYLERLIVHAELAADQASAGPGS